MTLKRASSHVDLRRASRILTTDRIEDDDMEWNAHVPQDISVEADLCKSCVKLNIADMFEHETRPKDIGPLKRYTDLTCPFCAIIWDSIRMHWESSSPLDDACAQPRLFIQSKEWCKFEHRTNVFCNYRIVLAITHQPPNFQLKRRVLPTDQHNRFVLAELELVETPASGDSEFVLRRPIKPNLDPCMVRRWLDSCDNHDHAKITTRNDLFRQGFRLIDVLEARLVEKMEPCDYVALSYVWGAPDPFGLRTAKRNVYLLKESDALKQSHKRFGKRIPQVIVDAMALCNAIGNRFLWVDSLCIVQDDLEEKKRLIHGMGFVYENAYLTLFATSGQDANAGLAGITARSDLLFEDGHRMKTCSGIIYSAYIARRADQKVSLELPRMDLAGTSFVREMFVFHATRGFFRVPHWFATRRLLGRRVQEFACKSWSTLVGPKSHR